jgi:hypothetical protein
MAGVTAAAVKLTGGANLRYVATGLGLPLSYVQLADKWGKRRGIPFEWVLTTILVESRGRPGSVGDDGKSIGLMQVNTVAHAAELATAGVTRERMFQPATNIEWGTKYLREFRDKVLEALGGRKPPIPLDYIVRLAYKGPTPVYGVLQRGGNPAELSWAPEALRNWHDHMTMVRGAEARGKALLTRGRQTV